VNARTRAGAVLTWWAHAALHRHVTLTRGLEELMICAHRLTRRVVVYHRPHAHAPWRVTTLAEVVPGDFVTPNPPTEEDLA
jgi:hypothetical protein